VSEVRVYAGATNPSHELSLSDGVLTWGLRLESGPEAIVERPLTPSTLRLSGVSGFGAWEPGLAQIEQRDWSGGRGAERLAAETARSYFDGQNAWTLSPGRVHAAPQWSYARGLRAAVQRLPGDVSWVALIGAQRSLASAFTIGAANLAAKRARLWLRRVGSPGELNVQLHTDAAGLPGAIIPNSGDAATIVAVPDVISLFRSFDVSAMAAPLSAAATYHLSARGAADDNAANHWELAVEPRAGGGARSADGDAWSAAAYAPYYRVEDADRARNFLFFELGGALYAADQRADGSPSHLYLNGGRGVATSATATSLSDSHQNWPADQWAGAWVRIVTGKGAGQARAITANTAGTLTVPAWDQTPDTTSQYVIYATELWQDISPASGDLIDGCVRSVAIVDEHALLAQGAGVPILRVRFNAAAGTPSHEFEDDGANAADLLHAFHHPAGGPQVWRGLGNEVARAAPAAWATPLTFGTGIKLGEGSAELCALIDWQAQLWALKSDSFWIVNDSDQARRFNLGLRAAASIGPSLAWNGKLWFGHGPNLCASGGSDLLEFGPGGSGASLPAGRTGRIAGLAPLGAKWLAAAVDAGAGESSIVVWDGAAWHELLRAPQAGLRAGALCVQHCPGTQPRLWAAIGGDLAWLPLPADSEDPLADTNLRYQHEAVLVGSSIDMQAALLPKFLTRLSLVSSNLGEGAQVALDYQVDAEIGGAAWRQAGGFYSSPLDSLALNAGELHAFRPRLRLLSQRAARPAVVRASVLEGFARTPLKYEWELRVRLAELQADGRGGLDAAPEAFLAWLQHAARSAARIRLRAVWAALDDKYVIVEPPSLQRRSLAEGGVAVVKIREG
jgi:hypothetical protein